MCILNNINTRTRRAALMLTLAGACSLSAGAVKGVIIDQYGQPIPSAQITVKGTQTSVLSDAAGAFDIDLTAEKTVMVVAPGYMATEFNIGALKRAKDQQNVKIILTELNIPMRNELPAAYGGTQSKENYLGSESTVYTDEINKTIGSTIIPGLVGKMAGLNVSQYAGALTRRTESVSHLDLAGWYFNYGGDVYSDNSMYSITSRGKTPVVYVDGMLREYYSLDPDAVESVSLQKDALSTMFNGMQSSRPVLYITTKNPKEQGFRVSFTGRFGISSPIKKQKPLSTSDYAYLLNEALQNDGNSPIYDQQDYYAFLNGGNPYLYPDVNWFDNGMRDHSTSQYYNVNVSGGNNFAQYFVSLGYYYENGLFKDLNPDYSTKMTSKRYSIDSKMNINITSDFTAQISLLARLNEGNQPGSGYANMLNNIYNTPNSAYPIKNPNGTWGGNVSFTNNLYAQLSESGYTTDMQKDLLGMIKLNYDFDKYVKGLSVYAQGSVTVQDLSATFRTLQHPVFDYAISTEGDEVYRRYGNTSTQSNYNNHVSNNQQLWGRLGVDYERQWGKHYFKAGLSGDTRQNLHNYNLPSLPSNILQNVSYDYDKKYFAQLAVTESYYNRYAPGHRWGAFYAAGLGWDIARENFMAGTSGWLDKLKLRAVYGRTGDGVVNSGYYTYYQSYSQSGFGGYDWSTGNGSVGYTYENTPMYNPNITWEKAHKWNVGVDANLFNNRLLLQADYYNDKYFDLLQTRGKSIALLGTSYPSENIGQQRRTGGEITLTWQDHIGAFNYYITGNWNIEKSKVLFIDEQQQPYEWMKVTGTPVGAQFGLVADGFFTSMDEIEHSAVIEGFDNIQPGDIKYRDLNGDGVIDEFDRQVIGGDKPLQYYGFNFGFEWKGLEFSMDWQGVYNRDIYVNDAVLTQGFQRVGQSYGQAYELLLGRWTPETADTAILPRLSAGGNSYNTGGYYGSSFWVKNGNYLRCRNLYVGYTLPQTFCRNFLAGVRPKIFVNVQNLCTISGCDWVDPEVGFTSYPLQRTWSMGINLKF